MEMCKCVTFCQTHFNFNQIYISFYRNPVQLAIKRKKLTGGTYLKLQPKPSLKPSTKSTSRPSTNGTSKVDLLNRLQRTLQRKFDGRITELNIDDLQNYTVENGEGSCQIKCPVCDKLIKVSYRKYESLGGKNSYWILSDVARHINRHDIK